MSGFRIEKARAEDFDAVYPLLAGFEGSTLSKDHWKRLFFTRWTSHEDYCGLTLIEDGVVKGFLGLIFSERIIRERIERFCNVSVWYVQEDARSHSLPMLFEMLRLGGYTFTAFTASSQVASVFKLFGFTDYEVHQQVLLPVPTVSSFGGTYRCEFDETTIRDILSANDRRILDDHLGLDCNHVLLRSGDAYCYILFRKTVKKHLPFARAHYISNRDLFVKLIERATVKICLRLKVAGLLVEDRYVGGKRLRWSRWYPQQKRAYFKSQELRSDDVDTLYSELVLLLA